MITQVFGRALGMFIITVFLLACIVVPVIYMLYRSEEVDSRFGLRMGKDINRIARELKEAGVEDKTVQVLRYALQDVQRNTEDYVNSKSSDQFSLFLFMTIMFPLLLIFLGSAAMNRKNAMTNLSVARPRFASLQGLSCENNKQ
jgi:uncharacterized membrane protein YobD (UPF0266 family)